MPKIDDGDGDGGGICFNHKLYEKRDKMLQ